MYPQNLSARLKYTALVQFRGMLGTPIFRALGGNENAPVCCDVGGRRVLVVDNSCCLWRRRWTSFTVPVRRPVAPSLPMIASYPQDHPSPSSWCRPLSGCRPSLWATSGSFPLQSRYRCASSTRVLTSTKGEVCLVVVLLRLATAGQVTSGRSGGEGI